jgi:hypothetical protein
MHGDQRDGQAATITQFGQRRVGMVQHIPLQLFQQRATKCRLASGIGGLGIHRAGIAIAFDDILHRSLGDSETLGDLSHGLAVFQACGYDSFAKIYRCWFHGHYYTS